MDFLKILDIKTPIINSSELTITITKTKTERLIEICSQLEATCYISGIGGKDYLDESLFEEHKIELMYENFIHPKYNQLNGNFLKNMSIIDLLFNEGPNSKKLLMKVKTCKKLSMTRIVVKIVQNISKTIYSIHLRHAYV